MQKLTDNEPTFVIQPVDGDLNDTEDTYAALHKEIGTVIKSYLPKAELELANRYIKGCQDQNLNAANDYYLENFLAHQYKLHCEAHHNSFDNEYFKKLPMETHWTCTFAQIKRWSSLSF